jgi:hypothetical protein
VTTFPLPLMLRSIQRQRDTGRRVPHFSDALREVGILQNSSLNVSVHSRFSRKGRARNGAPSRICQQLRTYSTHSITLLTTDSGASTSNSTAPSSYFRE